MTLTPEQFNKIATKDDLEMIKEEMVTKNDFNQVMTAIDGLAKKFDNFQSELIANQAAHDRFEESITGLKGKVSQLESIF